jgi:hypothetical protein
LRTGRPAHSREHEGEDDARNARLKLRRRRVFGPWKCPERGGNDTGLGQDLDRLRGSEREGTLAHQRETTLQQFAPLGARAQHHQAPGDAADRHRQADQNQPAHEIVEKGRESLHGLFRAQGAIEKRIVSSVT